MTLIERHSERRFGRGAFALIRRLFMVLGTLSLLTTACGLQSDAARSLSQVPPGASNSDTGGLATQSAGGSVSGSTSGDLAVGGTSTAANVGGTSAAQTRSAGAASATSSRGATSGPTAGAGISQPSAAGGAYETIGITSSTINLGIHAPETGAAPIPVQAFATGTKLFWENHTVFGRKVVMSVTDDQYNPSTARQVCEQMSNQDLLVIGGAGTDQIQSCATDPVLSQSHTPYLSAGVTTNGLTSLPYYFAVSQTYAAQSSEVYKMTAQLYGADANKTWAVVTENTPNFADAQASIDSALNQQHVHYCNVLTPKYFSEQDASNAVTAAKNCGATVVYLAIDPNFWIDLVREAQIQLFTPDWVGPGVTNGENLVASPVCAEQAQIKAAFLSPYMGLDKEPADFAAESNPPPDTPAAERDLELLIYGTSQVIYNALLSVGSIQNLTRDNFMAALARFSASYGKELTVSPNIAFNNGHFGGTGAWELQLNCSQQQYTTAGLLSGS